MPGRHDCQLPHDFGGEARGDRLLQESGCAVVVAPPITIDKPSADAIDKDGASTKIASSGDAAMSKECSVAKNCSVAVPCVLGFIMEGYVASGFRWIRVLLRLEQESCIAVRKLSYVRCFSEKVVICVR